MSNEIASRLSSVIRECIQYVGSANYEHRERHALNEAARNIKAARDEKIDEIEFRPEPEED